MNFSPRFNDFCPVCYYPLKAEDLPFDVCGHAVCESCLERWRESSRSDVTTCPLCRAPIPQKVECLLPPTSPIRTWTRTHPRHRRRARRWDERSRASAADEEKSGGREAFNDKIHQKKKTRFRRKRKERRR